MKRKSKLSKKSLTILKSLVFFTVSALIIYFVVYKVPELVKQPKPTSEELMRQGKVTATFKQASYPNNVIFYDAKATPDIAKADFDISEYQHIDLLMYSDGCPICNKERYHLKDKVNMIAKKGNLVILINENQNIKPLRKYFKFPQHYRFPTLFEFEKDNMGKIILKNQKLL